MTEIVQVSEITPELVTAFARLIPQLNPACQAPTPQQLRQVVHSPAVLLFAARDPDCTPPIVGILTLVFFQTPTGIRGRIEDLVVECRARGRGIGEALCRAAVERARIQGAATLDLTSHQTREAAHRLYQRLGFERRDTHVYRVHLAGTTP
jgi:ribosomal protein S18 acetylase RimI-like enzyme